MALKAFCEDIVENVSIDFNNAEIQDITGAVDELLQRYVKKIAERGTFGVRRIHACGSMADGTAMWKHHPKYIQDNLGLDENYIEYDYLVLLEEPAGLVCKQGCKACKKIEGVELAKTMVDELFSDDEEPPTWLNNSPTIVDKLFHRELCESIVSICKCFSIGEYKKIDRINRNDEYTFVQTNADSTQNCDQCMVRRNTGLLHIATLTKPMYGTAVEPNASSIVLRWESSAKSLFPPDRESFQKDKAVEQLLVNIDFVPAFQIDHSDPSKECTFFLVAKRCSLCVVDGSWRMSYSVLETDAILNKLSTNHRKCFKFIKYLSEQVGTINIIGSPLNGYHIKTAVLEHSKDCEVSDDHDYMKCVFSIVYHLRSAYSCHYLYSYVMNDVNLIRLRDTDPDIMLTDQISKILECIASQSADFKTAACIRVIEDISKRY